MGRAPHGEDISQDTADAGGGPLEGFHGGGVIVGFDFEGDRQPLTKVDDSSVFTGADEDAIARRGKVLQ